MREPSLDDLTLSDQALSYYKTDKNGNESYDKDEDGNEIYADTDDYKKIYAIYKGEPIYAKQSRGDEYYPRIYGTEHPLTTSFGPKYAKDVLGNEKYPKNAAGHETALFHSDGKPRYAVNADGEEQYPKMIDGEEFLVKNQYIFTEDFRKYPLSEYGRPKYPINPNTKDETYLKDAQNRWSIGKDKHGDEVYARRVNGDEYFPPDNKVAHTKTGETIYPYSATGSVIFPKDKYGNESYIKDHLMNDVIQSKGKLINRYAKTAWGNEIYPKIITNDFKDYLINDKYAWTNGAYSYPLDENGNEYTKNLPTAIFSEKEYFPLGYPITNDNLIIVPQLGTVPYFLSSTISPTQENILGKLMRNSIGYRDFITNVRSDRVSRGAKKKYDILPLIKTTPPKLLMNTTLPATPPKLLMNTTLPPPKLLIKKLNKQKSSHLWAVILGISIVIGICIWFKTL